MDVCSVMGSNEKRWSSAAIGRFLPIQQIVRKNATFNIQVVLKVWNGGDKAFLPVWISGY